MSRNVPRARQEHRDQPAPTPTRLLKIILRDRRVFGLAMSDQNVDCADGQGPVTYYAVNAFDPSTLSGDINFSVDNAEGYALVSKAPVPGITTEMVEAGELDDAQWVMYLVNFEDLTPGRHVILDAGDLGEVRTRYGMIWIAED